MSVIDGSRRAFAAAAVCAGFAVSGSVYAQSDDGEEGPFFGPGLEGLLSEYSNGIERAAALSNTLVFETLEQDCNPFGVLDSDPAPRYEDISGRQATPGPLCTQDAFHVYLNARELVHTANELQGSGPTASSLGLDLEGLGLALRWTAAEELSAQGSMATEFANGQLSSLAGRLNALRFGSTGFGTAVAFELMRRSSPLLAQAGGTPEPATSESYSRWGGFLNYGFGYGSRAPTLLEDAFDFDGSEVTLGVDYRLNSKLVLGGIVGFTRQKIDFDEAASPISVVDGDIDADGRSLIVFALLQGERLTLSGSVGTQSLDYDITRNIQYPSFNPSTPSVYSVARSSPNSDVFTTTFNVGYGFGKTKFTLEPFLNVEKVDVTIDAFAESRSIDRLSTTGESRRFDLAVSRQDIDSLETSLGVRFQYVLTPAFGVVVPFWSVATHWEHENDSRTITTGYAALADVLGTTTFALPTDERDSRYHTLAIGASTVLRGGRQREAGGPVTGGLSAFLQLVTVEQRRYFDDQSFTIGFRYEF